MKSFLLMILFLITISSPIFSEQINVMFTGNYYPFEFVNDEGLPDGFTIDLIYAIAREAAYTVILSENNWKNKDDLLFNGVVDVSPGYIKKSDNPSIINSKPMFSVKFSLLYQNEYKLSDKSVLKNRSLIISSGDSSEKIISNNNYSEKIIRTKSWTDTLKALSIGYGDYTIMTRIHYLLSDLKLKENLKIMNNFNLDLPYGFYSTSWNKNIIEKMNNGISIIKASGEYDRIYHKWFGDTENIIIKQAENRGSISIYVITSLILIVILVLYINKRKVKK